MTEFTTVPRGTWRKIMITTHTLGCFLSPLCTSSCFREPGTRPSYIFETAPLPYFSYPYNSPLGFCCEIIALAVRAMRERETGVRNHVHECAFYRPSVATDEHSDTCLPNVTLTFPVHIIFSCEPSSGIAGRSFIKVRRSVAALLNHINAVQQKANSKLHPPCTLRAGQSHGHRL